MSSILQCSNDLITSEDFLAKHQIGNSFTRSGKLSFPNMIYFILQSSRKLISINYSQFLENFVQNSSICTKTGGCKRQGISHKAFLELFRLSVRQFYFLSSDLHTWNSFHVYAVDGSTIQIPESKENYEVFGRNPNKTKRESPRASISVLYNVMNDIVFNDSLHSYRYNERESSLFTYPSFGNKESLNLKSVHFLLGNVNIAYLVTNLMLEQMTATNFQIYTGCDEELKVSTENLKTGLK